MKMVAVMQPYFFPYIGYFQLINAVDEFIIYDDVNFIKQGWINRNRILLNKKEFNFTLQIKGASSFKKINEITIGCNRDKLIKTLEQAYKKAPYFYEVFPMFENILSHEENNLAKFLSYSLRTLAGYLNIKTAFSVSSEIVKNNDFKGQEKVLEICRNVNANIYINAIGGQELYNSEVFSNNNIQLNFIKSKAIAYRQFDNGFVCWLSIIDVLMFNNIEKVKELLKEFELQ